MKIFEVNTELSVIKSLCGKSNLSVKNYILKNVNEGYFGYDPCREIFKRIISQISLGNDVSFSLLKKDLSLSSEARSLLSGSIKRLTSLKRAKEAISILSQYRKLRNIYFSVKQISEAMNESDRSGSPIDIDNLVSILERTLLKVREDDVESDLVHIGVTDSSTKEVISIIKSKIPDLIPTGFHGYDSVNLGFPRKGVVVLAASTSGGKTALALQLMINFYRQGISGCLVSLEMDKEEILNRMISNISKIPHDDIVQRRLTKPKIKKIKKSWKEFVELGKKLGCRMSILVPRSDVGFDEVAFRIKQFGYSVVVIDYINLLKQDPKLTRAESLGEITRKAKQFSRRNRCLVIILAQLSDDDKVKYSRAIHENADVLWVWRYGKEEKQTKLLNIVVKKARNQKTLEFFIRESFETMSLYDDPSMPPRVHGSSLVPSIEIVEDVLEEEEE